MSDESDSSNKASNRLRQQSEHLRSKIEAQNALKEKQRKKELFRRRIELARQGVRAYQKGKISEAVRCFMTYLHILEEWKGVPEGGLDPSKFDLQKDIPELLLISGVYWDLAKLYDRTKSSKKQQEFHHYLEKYILFTKGMPFQSVASETLRKYIMLGRPVHRSAFTGAYKTITGSNCMVATSLLDVCQEQTWERLQNYRDHVLLQSKFGRLLTCFYYGVSPYLSRAVCACPLVIRKQLGSILDQLANTVAPGSRFGPRSNEGPFRSGSA